MKMTREGVNPPIRKTKGSCGYDISCPEDVDIYNGTWVNLDLGILMEKGDIPDGYCALIVPRSSMGVKIKLRVANTVGVIDSDYTMDTIKAMVTVDVSDQGKKGVSLRRNDRILQMVLVPFGVIATERPPTKERVGGYGSTGV